MVERCTYRFHFEDILDEVDILLGGTGVYCCTLVCCDADRTDGVQSGDGSAYALDAECILDLFQGSIVDLWIDDGSEVIDEDVVSCSVEVIVKKGYRRSVLRCQHP